MPSARFVQSALADKTAFQSEGFDGVTALQTETRTPPTEPWPGVPTRATAAVNFFSAEPSPAKLRGNYIHF
jgi:hypothetical protein